MPGLKKERSDLDIMFMVVLVYITKLAFGTTCIIIWLDQGYSLKKQ